MLITAQESDIHPDQAARIEVSDLVKRLIEQVSFEARTNEYVDKKSGVSARLTIAAYENAAVRPAERRAGIVNGGKNTPGYGSETWLVSFRLSPGRSNWSTRANRKAPTRLPTTCVDKAIRTVFTMYFPNPEQHKKKQGREESGEIPFRPITTWFYRGNQLNLFADMTDAARIQQLYKVDGLHALVKKHFKQAGEKEAALLMEFVLHGLSAIFPIVQKGHRREDRVQGPDGFHAQLQQQGRV